MATLILLLTGCATVVRPTFDQIRRGTIRGIAETPITLRDGVWVGPEPAPGGASAVHVTLWNEPVACGDLDGQSGDEAVALASATTGGSGSFVYIAAFAWRDGRLAEATATLVGDRVKVLALKTYALQGSALVPVAPTGVAGRRFTPGVHRHGGGGIS